MRTDLMLTADLSDARWLLRKRWIVNVGYVIDVKGGRSIAFNPNNLVHTVGVKASTFNKPQIVAWVSVSEAWFVDHHRICDCP